MSTKYKNMLVEMIHLQLTFLTFYKLSSKILNVTSEQFNDILSFLADS